MYVYFGTTSHKNRAKDCIEMLGSSTLSFEHSGRLESDNKLPTLLAKLFWSLASVKVVLEGRNVGSGEG